MALAAAGDNVEVMSDLERLNAAVVAAPTDPAPRRAYADAVRPTDRSRAELIDLQLAIRDARRAGQQPSSDQTNRARALAHGRGKAWAGKLASLVQDLTYYGGFVELVRVTPTQLAASLFKQAPIRHLTLRGLHGHVDEVAKLPVLANLVSLDVNSNQLTDAEVAALVASAHLRGLQVLRINNNAVGMEALRAIGRALPDLRYVETMETEAPLIERSQDAVDGSSDARFTGVQGALLKEFPNRAWLKTLDEPHLDAL